MTITNLLTGTSKKLSGVITAIVFAASMPLQAQSNASADVQLDVLKHRLVEAIKVENHPLTLKLISDAREMGRPLNPEFDFFEGNAFNALGKDNEAEAALNSYITAAGPRARNYKPAIAMLSKIMERKEARQIAARRAEEDRQRRAEAHASMLAASVRVGQVNRINTEWGYAVVTVDAGADTLGGPTLYALTPEGRRVDLKPGKLTGNELSATSANAAALTQGMIVYKGPASTGTEASANAVTALGLTAVRVARVTPGSGGATSGLEAGDIIVSVFVPDANSEVQIRNKDTLMRLSGRPTGTSNPPALGNSRLATSSLLAGVSGALSSSSAPSPFASSQPRPAGIAEFAASVGSSPGRSELTRSFVVKVLRNGNEVRLNGLNIDGVELQDVSTSGLKTHQ